MDDDSAQPRPAITEFWLPEIYSPVPYRVSPLATDPELRADINQWAAHWMPSERLYEHVGTGLRYASLYCPDCRHPDRFVVLVKFMALMAAFDDQDTLGTTQPDNLRATAADHRSFAEQTRAALEIHQGTKEPESLTEHAFQHCLDEVRATYPTPWVAQRYVEGVAQWLHAMVRVHNEHRTPSGDRPSQQKLRTDLSFTDIVEFRLANGGILFTAALLEGLCDFDLEQVWPRLEDLWRLVFGAVILLNDIFSFRREYYAGETTNAVYCLHVNDGLPFQEAVDYLAAFINERVLRFQAEWPRRLRQFPPGARDEMTRYFHSVELMIAGNVHMQRTAPRYHGFEPAEPLPFGLLVMDPDRTIVLPRTRPAPPHYSTQHLPGDC
ncbi:terpene synthase family protein [Nocardia brasiliensis]